MDAEQLQLGASLADRAAKLNLIGTTTQSQVRQSFTPGTPWKTVDQVFRGMGILDALEFAVVRRDWDTLGTLKRFRDDLLILRTLGEGGMGVVYQALDTNIERIVAIKVIRPDKLFKGAAQKILQRFQREATILAQLSERSIVRLFEAKLTPEGEPYLVMEYVPGNSLSTVLKRMKEGAHFSQALCPPKSKLGTNEGLGLGEGPGVLDPIRVATWGRSLAKGLHTIHQLGIVHRDIKPANILISEAGEAMLIDFGIAFDVNGERLTDEGTTVGTALYLAPEILSGEPPSPQTDVFALGVTLYEALTGTSPFHTENPLALAVKILDGRVPPLRGPDGVRPDLPEKLEAIVMTCLAGEKADRYPDMHAVGEALQAFLDDPETRKPAQVPWWALALAVLAVVATGVVGTVVWLLVR